VPLQNPTFSEFLAVLKRDFGVTVQPTSGISGPRGDVEILYLKRVLKDGSARIASLQDFHDGQQLHPTTVRSICHQLSVPVDAFGQPQPDSCRTPGDQLN